MNLQEQLHRIDIKYKGLKGEFNFLEHPYKLFKNQKEYSSHTVRSIYENNITIVEFTKHNEHIIYDKMSCIIADDYHFIFGTYEISLRFETDDYGKKWIILDNG